MTTVKDVLKAMKSKNRPERASIAQRYPNIVTSSYEEICEAALKVLSAEQLEHELTSGGANGSSSMSSELEQELMRTMQAHETLPSGTAPKVKTLEVDEQGNLIAKPGRPSAEHKRILKEQEDLRRDPREEKEAFELVKTYSLSGRKDDDDDDMD